MVSKEGYIYSSMTNKPLSVGDNGHGYKVVSLKLKNNRKYKKAYVHRIRH